MPPKKIADCMQGEKYEVIFVGFALCECSRGKERNFCRTLGSGGSVVGVSQRQNTPGSSGNIVLTGKC